MQIVALIIVTASGLWLVAVSFLMALRPRTCLQLLEKMTSNLDASNWRPNLTEQGLRIVAGAALIVRSPLSKLPLAFQVAGLCIVISSLLILALPIRWHAAYGHCLSRWLTPLVLRFCPRYLRLWGRGSFMPPSNPQISCWVCQSNLALNEISKSPVFAGLIRCAAVETFGNADRTHPTHGVRINPELWPA
jgi:hypothetical protein